MLLHIAGLVFALGSPNHGPYSVSNVSGSEYVMKSWSLNAENFTVALEVNSDAGW